MSGTEPSGMNAHGKPTARPVALQGDLANLPAAFEPMKALDNWVCWKWERRNGKWTKPPYRPQGGYARNNDPATWASYDEAVAAYKTGKFDGIGFNLSGTELGVFDLDDCRDPASGEIAAEAKWIVDLAKSYTEITPSGTGLRVIGFSDGDKVHRVHKLPGCIVQIESYRGAERYITVTGNPQPYTKPQIVQLGNVFDVIVSNLDKDKANGPSASKLSLDEWIKANGGRYYSDRDYVDIDDLYLPRQLKALIANVPPAEDRSSAFHHAVCTLHFGMKWSANKIESYLDEKPVVPDRYRGRLQQEIYRCLYNSNERKAEEEKQARKRAKPKHDTTREPEPVISSEALRMRQFEPIKYVVPDLIVEGLTLFAGKPKIGKSWFLMHAAIAVASGGVTLGETQCDEGDVLYCALEDNLRRLQSRMDKLLPGAGEWPARLFFRTEMPRLTEGGLEDIQDWITAANHPRLVIIDTLAMVRPAKGRDESSYDADYNAVKELRDLANECGVAIVIVHHQRKAAADDAFDTVSGTLGLTGAPDSILVLKHDITGVVLHGRGRDLTELEKALAFDKVACKWHIKGDAAAVRQSDERNIILSALDQASEPIGPRQIAEAVGMKPSNVRYLLHKMLHDRVVVQPKYGKYRRCLDGPMAPP